MLEAINRICDLQAEVTRSQIIIQNKDHMIQQNEEHNKQLLERINQLERQVMSLRQAENMRGTGDNPGQ